ncbi:MAG: hypothetical protein IKK39_01030, partial [Thermoguttaceae bacterium]|nr:hypothetical protein [Thermoguttaceae bacterium]
DAARALGICYLNGDAGEENPDEGVRWLLIAAEAGDADAAKALKAAGIRVKRGKSEGGLLGRIFGKGKK